MKNRKNIIIILTSLTVSVMIVAFTILFVVLDKKSFSDIENRNLAKFPEFTFEKLKNGEFIDGLEDYLADHFPFRNEFMALKTVTLKNIGEKKIGEIYLAKDGYLLEEYDVKPTTTTIPIETLNRFYNSLPENTKMSLMLVPTSVEIMSEKLPSFSVNTSQREVIDYVYSKIDFEGINVYDYLEAASKSIDIYYKTDHHWNTFGAYLGFVSYMNAVGLPPLSRPTFEKITDDFYGTFYSKVIDNSLEEESMYKLKDVCGIEYRVKNVATNKVTNTLYEEKWLNEKDKYSYFLGQNQALLEINNISINTNKKILVIKDSYANAMIPFLTEKYKYVYVIDPRLYRLNISDYIKENNIEEILLVYNVKTVESDLGIGSIR